MRSPLVSTIQLVTRYVLAPCLLAVSLFYGGVGASAQQVRIPLPKKSKFTPVQQLNRDGVAALKKHDIAKAKRLFYKAYLIDPNDPFTLNNLGYVSELEGSLDRAQRYYDQARANTSEAVIDRSTADEVQGKTVASVAGSIPAIRSRSTTWALPRKKKARSNPPSGFMTARPPRVRVIRL
jgi:tetratricopeptide (TPR) repeat protein